MNSWILLFVAGICEVFWAVGLKMSHGLQKPIESVITVFFMILSFYFLAVAAREIPISVSYTVWVGIGAIGTFFISIFLFDEKTTFKQILFFLVMVIGLIGLKISTPK